ncbi:MAG: sulfite exporter TauE/SafE family protein [Myxococcales bacterium]|nr:sulfite exporter TauE/SafE family protein [Myxococcales bacterium]
MGFVLGLLGGGGSILAVPILVFLLGVPAKAAIATSLLVVGATSAFAAIGHARHGNVVGRTGLIFGAFAMVGAYGGGRLAAFIPGDVLLMLFAVLMLVTAIAMIRGRSDDLERSAAATHMPIAKIAAEGVVVGGITGLVGAGGGFLVVPALALLGGLDMRRAIGTSLMVIAMKSFAGFIGYAGHVQIDLRLVATFVVASLIGTALGTQTARRVDARRLRTSFAVFVLAMGAFILVQRLGLVELGRPGQAPQDAQAQAQEASPVSEDPRGA